MSRIPAGALPDEARARQLVLDEYVGRRLAEVHRATPESDWELGVRPFDDPEMHVDPELMAGLAGWGLDDVRAVPVAVRGRNASILSLEDSWTAVAWSRALQGTSWDRLTVLHVDDHDDLMSPLLAEEPGDKYGFHDLISGADVDLRQPSHVEGAVISGAIGVAGFVAPFVRAIDCGEYRHLCHERQALRRPRPLAMQGVERIDDLIEPGAVRPGILLEGQPTRDDGWTYRATMEPSEWIEDVAEGPVVVHIDFDYFCNRFDGDSDWRTNSRPNDVSLGTALERVDAVVAALAAPGLTQRILAVSAALSPGFFPADMWPTVTRRLVDGLGDIGVSLNGWL